MDVTVCSEITTNIPVIASPARAILQEGLRIIVSPSPLVILFPVCAGVVKPTSGRYGLTRIPQLKYGR
jgi:hypothetical protein